MKLTDELNDKGNPIDNIDEKANAVELTDGALEDVVGGNTSLGDVLEYTIKGSGGAYLGSKTKTSINTVPYVCKKDFCKKTFYITKYTKGMLHCPYCDRVYSL